MRDNKSGSKGVLEGLSLGTKEVKNKEILEDKNKNSEECVKRSYALKASTVKKLQELKVFVYTDPNITYNEIVDEAINYLYESKKIAK